MGGFGASFSAGVRAVQNPQAAEQDRQNLLQMKISPLAHSLQADQARLEQIVDPATGLPKTGFEHHYQELEDRMAETIGQMRAHLGEKEPTAGVLDRLHIRKNLHDRVKAWQDQNKQTAASYAEGAIPFEQTPEGQKVTLESRLRDENAASKWENFKLEDGRIVSIDTRHQNPPPGALKVGSTATSVRSTGRIVNPADAITTMGVTGQPLAGPGGTTWTKEQLEKLPKGTVLAALAQGDQVYYVPVDQRTRTASIGGQVYQIPEAGEVTPQSATSLGVSKTPTTHSSVTTDQSGVVTSRTENSTTPSTPGMRGSTPSPAAPAFEGPKTKAVKAARAASPAAPPAKKELDENSHIPATAGNPYLVMAANELLDGKSQKDLQVPQKDKMAAAALASEYGYLGEGMFTPRERMQVDQSQQLMDSLRRDKEAMSVFDEGPIKRALIQTAIDKAKTHGLTANISRAIINTGLNEKDVMFVQDYLQLIGRVQALAQLTRGNGRPTEAAVNRMMQELPNVLTAKNQKEAQHAFDLIQDEINIGMGKRKGGPKTDKLRETQKNGADSDPLGVL